MDYESEISGLKDTLAVMAEIQRRQAEVRREQAERSAEHELDIKRIDRNLAEATEKLNALVEIVDGVIPKPPPENGTSA